MLSFFRRTGSWVAMPAGQRFVLHTLAPMHPIACMAALDTAMPSAPRAIALAKSAGVRRPPMMMSVTSLRFWPSKNRRALARAGIVGTEMLSLKISGAALSLRRDHRE